MEPAIVLDHLTMVYKDGFFRRHPIRALQDICLEVPPGEIFGFLGPNGAGKTTTINTLMGFIFATEGTARVLGQAPGHVQAKRKIGYLPENFAFYKFLTAEKLLRFHMRLGGKNPAEALIKHLLATVKLETYAKLKVGKFSRGMMQRIGLAQALANDPELLILDEPTSGLDPVGRKEVRELMLGLKAQGKTIFLSSHLLSEVEMITDRIAIIDHGQLKQVGKVSDLLQANNQVEIVVDGMSDALATQVREKGGHIVPASNAVKIIIDSNFKMDLIMGLATSGANIVSVNPVRSTLEELFVKAVE
jgi:ABC-2 type transport system ATP-binding protein